MPPHTRAFSFPPGFLHHPFPSPFSIPCFHSIPFPFSFPSLLPLLFHPTSPPRFALFPISLEGSKSLKRTSFLSNHPSFGSHPLLTPYIFPTDWLSSLKQTIHRILGGERAQTRVLFLHGESGSAETTLALSLTWCQMQLHLSQHLMHESQGIWCFFH